VTIGSKAATYAVEDKHRIKADIHSWSEIRTHDPSVGEGEGQYYRMDFTSLLKNVYNRKINQNMFLFHVL
jgi:hypothetical protein